MELNALYAALQGVSAYREVTNTALLGGVCMLLDALRRKNGEEALEYYVSRFHLLRSDGCEGLGDWLWDWLRYNETRPGERRPAGHRDTGPVGGDRLRPLYRRPEAPAGQ